ncbi:MAG TPA: DUF6687 family protein [Acidimicrobiales bacterium]|nr:DUF6687 family protein [Acidimicrobiales bacterium]
MASDVPSDPGFHAEASAEGSGSELAAGGLGIRRRFRPVEEVVHLPHVMVDGAPLPASAVTLSHWPQSTTPPELARDLSVQIAFAYLGLERAPSSCPPRLRTLLAAGSGAEAVTNDHYDEDGLMSVLTLVDPELALEHEELMVAVAACGDFGVLPRDPELAARAATAAFAIGPLADSLVGAVAGAGERYLAVLPSARELLANPGRFEALVADELASLSISQATLSGGKVELDEDHALDLAVIEVPGAGSGGGQELHPVALRSATGCSRLLVISGSRVWLELRYESWVRYVSRRVPLRPDLAPLAAELSSLEPGGVRWMAEGVGAIVCRLEPEDGSTDLAPSEVVARVRAHLARAPGAWDPFRPGGPHLPARRQRTGRWPRAAR